MEIVRVTEAHELAPEDQRFCGVGFLRSYWDATRQAFADRALDRPLEGDPRPRRLDDRQVRLLRGLPSPGSPALGLRRMAVPMPTEPIGSILRPAALLEEIRDLATGRMSQDAWRALCDQAVRDTMERFEATGSPVITDEGQEALPPIRLIATQDTASVVLTPETGALAFNYKV